MNNSPAVQVDEFGSRRDGCGSVFELLDDDLETVVLRGMNSTLILS